MHSTRTPESLGQRGALVAPAPVGILDSRMDSNVTVPGGWRIVRLGDVAEVSFSSVDKKVIDSEVPVRLCNYTDVFYNRRIHSEMEFMAATATPREFRQWSLKKDDVLFTKDSETSDEVGIASHVVHDMNGVLCGYHLGLARPRGDLVDGAFLTATLGSRTSQKEFARIANGTTRFGLTLESTRSLPLLLPPLHEQRVIATILISIRDVIEATENARESLEHLQISLLNELLTRGIPGLHSAFRYVPGLGSIPVNWDIVQLRDVATVRGGVTFPPARQGRESGDYPFIKVSDMNLEGNEVYIHRAKNYVAAEDLSELRATPFPPGSVVFPKVGAAIGTNKKRMCTESTLADNNIVAVAVNDYRRCTPDFLFHWFRSIDLATLANTSTVPSITGSRLKCTLFPLPSLAEQELIATVLASADLNLAESRNELQRQIDLQDSISESLLSGHIRSRIVTTSAK